jgi:hypothetical protein
MPLIFWQKLELYCHPEPTRRRPKSPGRREHPQAVSPPAFPVPVVPASHQPAKLAQTGRFGAVET